MGEAKRKRARVAIDGPAGAGKSSVARRLAERLDYVLVDTGALYRAVALAAKRADIAWDDEPGVGALATSLMKEQRIGFERAQPGSPAAERGTGVSVLLDGEDISLAIREHDMSMGASRVSAIPAVREALLDIQRQAGELGGVVLEGRDIGTVVFPDAEVKFFLTASPEVRAGRRHEELRHRGEKVSFEETLADVLRRDRADTDRPIAPLRQAEDALLVDSSGLSIDEVVEEMARRVEDREKA